MQKLKSLSTFLMGKAYTAINQFDSWAEDTKLHPLFKDDGEGLTLFEMEYTAVFVWTDFNFNLNRPEELFANVLVWLHSNDSDRVERGLDHPDFDVDVKDDTVADVELKLSFIERVGAVPDPDGAIEINGENYRLDTVPVWIATEGEVIEDE
jgi:hypothetical protein